MSILPVSNTDDPEARASDFRRAQKAHRFTSMRRIVAALLSGPECHAAESKFRKTHSNAVQLSPFPLLRTF